MEPWNKEERRINSRLHEDDIALIVTGVSGSLNNHLCRFARIETKNMEAIVEFVEGIMDTTKTTKKLIWKIIVSVTVVALLGWMAIGFAIKMKDVVMGYIK